MSDEGEEFETVLRAAQAQGLAEADPSFDIDGIDAAHKLTLLSMLAFGVRVPFASVYTEGIRHVSQSDILFAPRIWLYDQTPRHCQRRGGCESMFACIRR